MSKSLTGFVAALSCILVFCGLASSVAWAQATSQPDVKAICNEIAKACPDAVLKAAPTPDASEKLRDAEDKLKGLTYDDAMVKVLDEQLKVSRPGPAEVKYYIANLLVEPLLDAKPEVMKKALPSVEAAWKACGGGGEFKDFNKFTPAQLAPLQQPPAAGKDAAGLLAAQEAVNKLQEKKNDADHLVELHNKEAWKLQYAYFRMCVIAGDAAKDKEIVKFMEDKEEVKLGKDTPATPKTLAIRGVCDGQWLTVSEAVKKEVKSLSKERAKFYYDEFKKLGTTWKWNKWSFIEWDKPTMSRTENSRYEAQEKYMGHYLLEIVNLLSPVVADPANAPAVVVPTEKEIDAYIKTLEPKPAKQNPNTPKK